MDNVSEHTDPRVRKDPTLYVVICLLGIGAVGTAYALAVNDLPKVVRGLGREATVATYVHVAGFVLMEAFLVGMAVLAFNGCVRGFSTRATVRGVSQLRPLLFRRVSIPYGEVTALREKGGCLWVESAREAMMLASPLSHRNPEGLLAFLKERVPPGTRYIPEN